MRFCKSIFLTAAVCLLPLAGQATSVRSKPTLSIEDITFDDFSCHVTKEHATPRGCGSIDVSAFSWPGAGLDFWSHYNAHSDGLLAFDDASIKYHVTSNTPIDSIGLSFDGTFWGSAISSVTETVYNAGHKVGFAEVACVTDTDCTRSDTVFLDGSYKDLWVTESIDVASLTGVANIVWVNDSFGTAAPEPASIGLVGAALIGVAFLGRRRAKAVTTA